MPPEADPATLDATQGPSQTQETGDDAAVLAALQGVMDQHAEDGETAEPSQGEGEQAEDTAPGDPGNGTPPADLDSLPPDLLLIGLSAVPRDQLEAAYRKNPDGVRRALEEHAEAARGALQQNGTTPSVETYELGMDDVLPNPEQIRPSVRIKPLVAPITAAEIDAAMKPLADFVGEENKAVIAPLRALFERTGKAVEVMNRMGGLAALGRINEDQQAIDQLCDGPFGQHAELKSLYGTKERPNTVERKKLRDAAKGEVQKARARGQSLSLRDAAVALTVQAIRGTSAGRATTPIAGMQPRSGHLPSSRPAAPKPRNTEAASDARALSAIKGKMKQLGMPA